MARTARATRHAGPSAAAVAGPESPTHGGRGAVGVARSPLPTHGGRGAAGVARTPLPRHAGRTLRSGCAIAFALAALATGARAETSGVSPAGFLVSHRVGVSGTPQRLFEAFGQIGRWWNAEHSYSGDGRNLTLDLKAGGCFCERWPGGSVLHAQVVFVDRTNHVVRLLGGLGPLQERAVHAVLTLAAETEGARTILVLTYRVTGPSDVGLEQSAGPVDRVLGEAAQRLAAYVERGKP